MAAHKQLTLSPVGSGVMIAPTAEQLQSSTPDEEVLLLAYEGQIMAMLEEVRDLQGVVARQAEVITMLEREIRGDEPEPVTDGDALANAMRSVG